MRWPALLLGAGVVLYTVGSLMIYALGPTSPLIQIFEVAGAAPYALGFVLLSRAWGNDGRNPGQRRRPRRAAERVVPPVVVVGAGPPGPPVPRSTAPGLFYTQQDIRASYSMTCVTFAVLTLPASMPVGNTRPAQLRAGHSRRYAPATLPFVDLLVAREAHRFAGSAT